jgi:hypothetical protein
MAPRLLFALGVVLFVAALAPLASGRDAARTRKLPFRTIVHTSHSEYGEYGPPRVVLATTRAQLLSRVGPLAAADQPRVAGVDLRRYVVVGAFGGGTPACCAQLTVKRVSITGRQLCVVALSVPPGTAGQPSEGYHIVAVRRPLLMPAPKRWRLLRPDGSTIRASRSSRACR